MIRGFLVGLMFSLGILAPWWMMLVPALMLSVRWTAYEVIALGVFLDIASMPPEGLWGVPLVHTLAASGIVLLFVPLRRRLVLGN